jgi:hypothetical protein
MAPADAKALIEKWREKAEQHKKHGDCYRVGEGWALDQCADELEPVVQALEALRDTWRAEAMVGGCNRGRRDALEDCADELDAVLHGAGRMTLPLPEPPR